MNEINEATPARCDGQQYRRSRKSFNQPCEGLNFFYGELAGAIKNVSISLPLYDRNR